MEIAAINEDLKVKVSYKQILSIAMPITLAILIPQINLLTNTIFLGNYSTESLGNAGITGVYYLIFAVVGHGLNSAIQTVFSRHAGSGDSSSFNKILAQGIRISLQLALVGILFTWFIAPHILKAVAAKEAYPEEISFLRIRIWGLPFLYMFLTGNAFLVASLNSKYLMIGFIFESGVNILLDYLLINGRHGFPQLGFNGAAVASVVAEFVGFIVVLIVLYKTGLKKKYGLLQDFLYNKVLSKDIIKVSAPLITQFVISVTTWLIFFFLIEERGNQADKAISNIMRNVFGFTGIFIWAFASTSNVVVSNLMGQNKEEKIIEAITKIMKLSFCFSLVMVILINIFPFAFFSLFGKAAEFAVQGTSVIRVVSAGLLIMSIANIWLNGVTGTGKTRVNLMIELVAITLYLIYTFIFMKWHFISLAIGWGNEIVYWTTIFILAFAFIRSGKWKTN